MRSYWTRGHSCPRVREGVTAGCQVLRGRRGSPGEQRLQFNFHAKSAGHQSRGRARVHHLAKSRVTVLKWKAEDTPARVWLT